MLSISAALRLSLPSPLGFTSAHGHGTGSPLLSICFRQQRHICPGRVGADTSSGLAKDCSHITPGQFYYAIIRGLWACFALHLELLICLGFRLQYTWCTLAAQAFESHPHSYGRKPCHIPWVSGVGIRTTDTRGIDGQFSRWHVSCFCFPAFGRQSVRR